MEFGQKQGTMNSRRIRSGISKISQEGPTVLAITPCPVVRHYLLAPQLAVVHFGIRAVFVPQPAKFMSKQ
jgi:hypothetical protein